MNFPLIVQIARTHLLSRMKQTVVASLGVTFGIAMFIFMISFVTGVNELLEETTLSATSHIHIFNDIESDRPTILDEALPDDAFKVVHHQRPKLAKQNLRNAFQILEVLQSDTRVLGVSPLISSQVFYNYGATEINGIIAGVDMLEEDKLFKIGEKIVAGRMENLLSSNKGLLMGKGLAQKLNAKLNDRVFITTPDGVRMLLTIVGIFQTGITQIDQTKSYANLSTVQNILQKDSRYITYIHLKLKDLNLAKSLAVDYERNFGYRAEDWETANATILVSFTFRNFITYAIVITLLLVAAFGIYNILNMTIYEKMKDIAILKATGFSGSDVTAVFMMQALIIGLAGGLLGLLLGLVISYAVSRVPFHADTLINIDHLPVKFDSFYYGVGLLFGIVTTGLAGYFPSRKAAKVDPVEIIRGK